MWLRFALLLVHSHSRWWRIALNVIEIHFTVGSHSEKGTHHTECDWDSLYCWFTLREGDTSHQMWLRFALMLVHTQRRWCIKPNVIEIHFKVGSHPQKVMHHWMWLRFALLLVHTQRRGRITPNVIEICFNVGSHLQKVVTHHTECNWDSL